MGKPLYSSEDDLKFEVAQKLQMLKVNRQLGHLRVLEISAGIGSLLTFSNIPNQAIYLCEQEGQANTPKEGYKLIEGDFTTYQTHTEYDRLIVNMAYDVEVKHCLHAIQLVGKQQVNECAVLVVMPKEKLQNPQTDEEKTYVATMNLYDLEVQDMDGLLKTEDYPAGLELVMVTLRITNAHARTKEDFEKQFATAERHHNKFKAIYYTKEQVVQKMDEIKKLVIAYQEHIKAVKAYYKSLQQLHNYESYVGRKTQNAVQSGLDNLNLHIEEVRKTYWAEILDINEYTKALTEKGTLEVYDYLEQLKDVEITEATINSQLSYLLTSLKARKEKDMVEFFTRVTKDSKHATNRKPYEGWQGQEAYGMKKKIIVEIEGYTDWDKYDMGERYGSKSLNPAITQVGNTEAYKGVSYQVQDFMKDLNKLLQHLQPDFDKLFRYNAIGEFENELIHFKQYKKRSLHIRFKEEALWEQFNIIVGRYHNWLPSEEEVIENAEAKGYLLKHFPKQQEVLEQKK